MFDHFQALDLWLWRSAGQATFWLILGLTLGRHPAARPARAHRLLLLAAGAALLAPVLGAVAQVCGWGLLVGPPRPLSFRVDSPEATPRPSAWDRLDDPAWLLPRAVLAVWLVGSAWLLLRLLRALAVGRRCFGRGRPVDDPGLQGALQRAARGLGLARLPWLVRGWTASPLLWCWSGRPRVVLPSGPLPGGPGLEAVLRQELAHLRRRDGWSALAGELLVVVFWWHPLAWAVRRRLALALEQAYPGGPGGWEFRKNSKSFGVFRGFKRCVDSSTPGPTRDFE